MQNATISLFTNPLHSVSAKITTMTDTGNTDITASLTFDDNPFPSNLAAYEVLFLISFAIFFVRIFLLFLPFSSPSPLTVSTPFCTSCTFCTPCPFSASCTFCSLCTSCAFCTFGVFRAFCVFRFSFVYSTSLAKFSSLICSLFSTLPQFSTFFATSKRDTHSASLTTFSSNTDFLF